ncbi:uncharacterized protein BP5553_03105 [Venustampulla echinocandica]|uniref:CFEM domain-containing protein n=1 Tax=Venustampulla echinocandica TaxID=2656787 RepID=A0A370TTB0_9HELO|nr:uncharacterized protein BP5553_03105 [Venustampulla echinocandica]RDL38765.1 hypothetical protein BP5553_03105 [Venustampulla echinocandica]
MKIFLPAAIFQLFFLSLSLPILAQIDQLPICSVSCYTKAIALTGCGSTDLVCQCGPASRTSAVQSQLTSCLISSCSSSDVFLYNSVAISVCATATATGLTPKSTTAVTAGSGKSTPTTVNPEVVATVTTTAAPTAAQSSGAKSEGKKNNVGLIVGVVVGVVGVIALIGAAILLCLSRRKRRAPVLVQHQGPPHPHPHPHPQGKSELHSATIPVRTSVVSQQADEFKSGEETQVYHQATPVPTQVNEMQGEVRQHIPEIQGAEAMRPGQPAELDSNWDWAAGRPRNPAAGPGV